MVAHPWGPTPPPCVAAPGLEPGTHLAYEASALPSELDRVCARLSPVRETSGYRRVVTRFTHPKVSFSASSMPEFNQLQDDEQDPESDEHPEGDAHRFRLVRDAVRCGRTASRSAGACARQLRRLPGTTCADDAIRRASLGWTLDGHHRAQRDPHRSQAPRTSHRRLLIGGSSVGHTCPCVVSSSRHPCNSGRASVERASCPGGVEAYPNRTTVAQRITAKRCGKKNPDCVCEERSLAQTRGGLVVAVMQ